MDLIKNFDFAEFDHDKILENVTPILLPERNVTSDQVSCKVPGMEDVRMLFAICQDEKLYLLTKKALMREKVLLEEMTDRVKMMDYDWQIDSLEKRILMILICCPICTIPMEQRRLHFRRCRHGCI